MKKTLLTCLSVICLTTFMNAQTTFVAKQIINGSTGNNPYTLATGDIDGDTYADIIVGTDVDNTLIWYKNNGVEPFTFTAQTPVTNTLLTGIGGLQLVDLNGDTFLDILGTGYSSDNVVWYSNNGSGVFTEQPAIGTVSGASGLATGTIDAGGTIDVAVTAYDGGSVVWFSNDGSGNFSGPTTIDNTLSFPGSIQLKNLSEPAPGPLDAVISTATASGNVDVVEIFRNDGAGNFTKDGTSVTTGKNYIFNASFEDLDGDAFLDILVTEVETSPGAGALYWIEEDGVGGYTETVISTTIANPAVAQHVDLDDDGDNDIVLSSGTHTDPGAGDLVWFINDGSGSQNPYGPQVIIDDSQRQAFVFSAVDFDNDGDLDIAQCAYADDDLSWFENLKYNTLNIESSNLTSISIYPNPTSNVLNFKGLNSDFTVSIYDILGKEILQADLNVDQVLDVSHMASGVYILTLNDQKKTFKFVKE